MIEAIIATVVGGVILMAIDFAFKGKEQPSAARKVWSWCTDTVGSLLPTRFIDSQVLSPPFSEAIPRLLIFLQADQDMEGAHAGQYGRSGDMKLTKDVFAPGPSGAPERPEAKPRLYLTGWPVFIYKKRQGGLPRAFMSDVRRQLRAVSDGIQQISEDGWVHVSLGAASAPLPFRGGRDTTIVSYRHSIRAAQILLALGDRGDIVRAMLGRMLDPSSGMQLENGGWAQCNMTFRENDLWCAAYACGFLGSCLTHMTDLELDEPNTAKIKETLEKSVDWLKEQWQSDNGWSYGKLSAHENSVPLFHEVATAMLYCDQEFALDVVRMFATYLDPIGNPSERTLRSNVYARPPEVASRLGYGFYLLKEKSEMASQAWERLCEYSVCRLDSGMNSADAAMLLDMLLENPYQTSRC